MKINKFLWTIVIVFIVISTLETPAIASVGDTTRVSVSSTGAQGNRISGENFISPDGQYIAFASDATNLVSGDTNANIDVFVRDLQGGITTRASISSSGAQSNGVSGDPSLSADGRYIAFYSYATNLVIGDSNTFNDVFMHDNQTGVTIRVSVDSSGNQASSSSSSPHISANGRYIVFLSSAPNLVSGDTYDGKLDVFMHDNQTGSTVRVSVDPNGNQANGDSYNPFITADGRYITYDSYATNLVSGDTNASEDVFIYDTQTATTERISMDSEGVEGDSDSFDASMSIDGRYVVYESYATNLVDGDTNAKRDIFLHDRQTGITTRVSVNSEGVQADGRSTNPVISADGRFIAFDSLATNLVDWDTNAQSDIFMYDRLNAVTTRVSVSTTGNQTIGGISEVPSISEDGHFVGFDSSAANLVNGDTNGVNDAFVRENDINHYTGIYYVKPFSSGTGNCQSWDNACTLQTALAAAANGDEIWAAEGIHKPTTGTDRTATFQLKNGIAVYGGFSATETAREQRDPAVNITILSGDIDNNDSQTPIITDLTTVTGNTTNSYHVVTGATGATLDGFTITAGNASGIWGGGLYNNASSPQLMNLIFSGNSATGGGGMGNNASSPILTNITFSGNSATAFGGGMHNRSNSSPSLTNVTFSGNSATTGGGMDNNYSNPILMNVVFHKNSITYVGGEGGGMSNYYSNPTLMNVTFSENSPAYSGGGMSNAYSNPTLTNVVFNKNSATNGGGGMRNSSSSPSLANVTFNENLAPLGGGMYNFNNSNPILTNVTFSGNSGSQNGGGMENYSSNPILTNVTFSNNLADVGGGMENVLSSPVLTNITFNGNSARIGGGMHNTASSAQIRNTIFWGNTASGSGPQVYISNGTLNVSDSVIQGGCPAGSVCTNIITTDPRLGTLGDYGGFTQTTPLLKGSSAIDTGNDIICSAAVGTPDYGAGGLDQRGIVRPQGTHCDIGAYEYIDPPPSVSSIIRINASPTQATSIDFKVTFSETVAGVDITGPVFDDFVLFTTGITGASITGVTGSGNTYTATVSTGSGDGTIRLDIPNTATITDLDDNSLSLLPFDSGEAYTITRISNKPDLIITNVAMPPTPLLPYQTFDISITIKNQGGTGSANTIYRDVYIDRDPSTLLDPLTHCPPPGNFFTSDSYASIPAGMTDTKTVTITGGLPLGNHQLWFYVDSRCLVDEGGGSNSVP